MAAATCLVGLLSSIALATQDPSLLRSDEPKAFTLPDEDGLTARTFVYPVEGAGRIFVHVDSEAFDPVLAVESDTGRLAARDDD